MYKRTARDYKKDYTCWQSHADMSRQEAVENVHSRKLTWKPQKGPIKTTVLLKGDYMGFHVSLGECSTRNNAKSTAIPGGTQLLLPGAKEATARKSPVSVITPPPPHPPKTQHSPLWHGTRLESLLFSGHWSAGNERME